MNTVLSWKLEPVSPPSEEASLFDESFYESSLDDIKFDILDGCESKAEVASHILENLEKLVDLDELIKDEPNFLLDEKMLPLLDEVEPPRAVPVPLKHEFYKPPEENSTYLFNEFEKVYYAFNSGTLTPPQSPPSEPVITLLGVNRYPDPVPDKPLVFEPQPDIAHELAVVDELVRSTVEDMNWSNASSPESSNSMFEDCSSSDPEWAPVVSDCSSSSEKKRSKPYSRNPDDKKNRKKEQNKNAATRYRMKKKQEVEVILNEEKQLLEHHTELTGQIVDIQREIKYLKGLMRDLFKAKGFIN